jgi:hypothetical protein
MVALLLGLIAFAPTDSLQTPPQIELAPFFFDEAHLGADGMAAFEKPDTVTIQRIYPDDRAESGEQNIGRWKLFAAGKEHVLGLGIQFSTREALSKPQMKMRSFCAMHPDHMVRFKKGDTVVSIVTCFGCFLMAVVVDDRYVGITSMPAGQPFTDLVGHIPFEEDCRAKWDEAAGKGFFDSLLNSKSATYQVVEFAAEYSLIPKWSALGVAKPLDQELHVELRSLLAYAPAFQVKNVNTFGIVQPNLPNSVMFTFKGEREVSAFFTVRGHVGDFVLFNNRRAEMPHLGPVREALWSKIVKLATLSGEAVVDEAARNAPVPEAEFSLFRM